MDKYFKTETEKKLFKRVCHLNKAYSDSNPDVGFGPWPSSIVQDEAEYLGIKVSREDAKIIANEIWPVKRR
jgi:hypothetical protein